jgi:Mlc titration factor MtfA (ptsG expression regulator)
MFVELFLAATVAAIALVLWWPRWRLRRLLAAPFPAAWDALLRRRLPVYTRLDAGLRAQLQRLIKRFLHQKTFYGCGGLEIDDEIRLSIAAQACLLLLNRPTDVFADLRYILVYPDAFVVPRVEHRDGGVLVSGDVDMEGESWDSGKVILSWQDAQHDAQHDDDGYNVVLHEFAHQLDQASGATDGTPLLRDGASYRRWAAVMNRAYAQLQRDEAAGHEGLLDHYGASDPAEFFAVVTEVFYEQPHDLAALHPDLFEELRRYYCVDPRQWQIAG